MKVISTLWGIVIILSAVVIFFGGAFTYEHFAVAQYRFEFEYPKNFSDISQSPRILFEECNHNGFPEKCPDINNIVIKDLTKKGEDATIANSNVLQGNYWEKPEGEKKTIGNVPYCLYKNSDAAMGHVFNHYYYVTVKNKKCLVLYFETNISNCDLYLPLEEGNTGQAKNYANCLKNNKDQDDVIKNILSTFKFTPVE